MDVNYKKSIIDYYDATRLDYRVLWLSDKNRAVHFGYYDKGIKDHGEALLNMNRVMATKAGIKDGDIVLDAGCGQGGSAVWLAEQVDVQVTGVTLVPHQVEKAERLARESGVNDRVSFFEKDYTDTGFADESYTVIWACESLCHALHKKDFYDEAYRLLKPGGRLICAEYFRTRRPLTDAGEALLSEWLDGWSINDIDTMEEHIQNAKRSGFIEPAVEDITSYTEPSLRHLHSMSSKLWGLGRLLKKIGLRNDVNHGNHYSSIKQYEALKEELWRYGLLSMTKDDR